MSEAVTIPTFITFKEAEDLDKLRLGYLILGSDEPDATKAHVISTLGHVIADVDNDLEVNDKQKILDAILDVSEMPLQRAVMRTLSLIVTGDAVETEDIYRAFESINLYEDVEKVGKLDSLRMQAIHELVDSAKEDSGIRHDVFNILSGIVSGAEQHDESILVNVDDVENESGVVEGLGQLAKAAYYDGDVSLYLDCVKTLNNVFYGGNSIVEEKVINVLEPIEEEVKKSTQANIRTTLFVAIIELLAGTIAVGTIAHSLDLSVADRLKTFGGTLMTFETMAAPSGGGFYNIVGKMIKEWRTLKAVS